MKFLTETLKEFLVKFVSESYEHFMFEGSKEKSAEEFKKYLLKELEK